MSAKIIQQWLDAQCHTIRGVESGMVALPLPGSDKNMVVQWPQAPRLKDVLVRAAGTVLKHRKALLQTVKKAGLAENTSSPLVVAAPLTLNDGGTAAASLVLWDVDTEAGKAILKHLNEELKQLGQQLAQSVAESAPVVAKQPHDNASQDGADSSALAMVTHLLATTLATPRFDAACAALATELATRLDCERVSIGIRHNGNTELTGISHNAEIKLRQDFSRSLVAVMDEAIDQGQMVPVPASGKHSVITLAADKFSRHHEQHALCTVPLVFDENVVGAMVLERAHDRPFESESCEVLEHMASFLAPVLEMKFRTNRPWWKRLQQAPASIAHWLKRKDTLLPKALIATVILMLVALALPLATYRINAPAHIEGLIQRSLTSPENSYIKDVQVRPGDRVTKGQVLVQLENKDLELRRQELNSKLAQIKAKYGSALASRDRTELAVLSGEMEETKATLELTRKQLERSQITSPFSGEVIDGDLTQSLGAPVKRGDVLMVLSPVGEYRIIFDVDESDIAALETSQQARMALTSNPSRRYPLDIVRISPMAKVKDGNNVFEVEARLTDATNHPELREQLRPGLEGLVKVDVQQRSLLWIGLHSFLNWLDFQLWRWLGIA